MKSSGLLYITGTPLDSKDDKILGERIAKHQGCIIVSGGSTAKVVSREIGKSIAVIRNPRGVMLPPESKIEGIDIVSEGVITLGFVRDTLDELTPQEYQSSPIMQNSVDKKIIRELLNHQHIYFLVGTRLNLAHFDKSLPITLERRVDIINEIAPILRERFHKNITIEYL